MSTGMIELSHRGLLDPDHGVLYCRHNSGFYSICTVSLWNLSEALKVARSWPVRIDYSQAFGAYRTTKQQLDRSDLQPVFFQPALPAPPSLPLRLPRVNHHGHYRFLDHRSLQPVVNHYFRPSPAAMALQAELIERHRIDLRRTIAVAYRGTDKSTEVRLASPRAYLDEAKRLLNLNPGYRVLIQTDERAVRDLFCAELADRCFFLPELPVSGPVDPNDGDEEQRRREHLDPCAFGVMLVAVWHLLSQAAYVVNHTGNMALWICLWRGRSTGIIQFDDTGSRVDFASPRFYLRQTGKWIRKLSHRLQHRWS